MIDMELSNKDVKTIVKNRKDKMTKEEREANIIEWTTFY